MTMVYLLAALLFAATASTQLTTSFWAMKAIARSDRVGFYGSVVNANSSHTTLAVLFDNGTDASALEVDNVTPWTYVVGPTVFGVPKEIQQTSAGASYQEGTGVSCIRESPSNATAEAVCTVSYGPQLAYAIQCATGTASLRTSYISKTYTYSGRGTYSAGVETIVETRVYGRNTMSPPSWCSGKSEEASIPLLETFPLRATEIATYPVIITAGLEKLSATQGESVPAPTGSVTNSPGAGVAAPLKTASPVVVGLGAALAVFVV